MLELKRIWKDCTATATLNLRSALGRLQILLSPDAAVKFPIKLFKRTIGPVGILDNERLWILVIKLSDNS